MIGRAWYLQHALHALHTHTHTHTAHISRTYAEVLKSGVMRETTVEPVTEQQCEAGARIRSTDQGAGEQCKYERKQTEKTSVFFKYTNHHHSSSGLALYVKGEKHEPQLFPALILLRYQMKRAERAQRHDHIDKYSNDTMNQLVPYSLIPPLPSSSHLTSRPCGVLRFTSEGGGGGSGPSKAAHYHTRREGCGESALLGA